MAYRPISRPDPLDSPPPSHASISLGGTEKDGLENGLSLAEWATALSKHGGGALSADLALDLVLNEIVEDARLATGATAAAIALSRDDEIVCRATTGDNAPDLGVRLEVHSGLSGACVQSKKWQRCDDTETDSRVNAEVCRELGVRSILVFPVVREDKLLGVVDIFSPRPSAFSDREIQTLEALSRSIVSNVDRAADVIEPPPAALPSSPTAAAIVAAVPEVEGALDLPLDLPERVAPIPTVDTVLETETVPEIRERDYWMMVLTLIVIGVAIFLGWMMGYVGRQKAQVGTRVKTTATALPAELKPPEGTPVSPSAAVPASEPARPALPAAAPAESQKNGTGVVTAGGLVVYENGKVVFRTPPQSIRTSAKDSSSPVLVPSKVADEYLIEGVEPEYPESAREQHIQGPVVLLALVGKDGAVEKLSTIKGDSQLATAATDAVQQWRFKPFFRNGSPQEFQTQITVSFRLP